VRRFTKLDSPLSLSRSRAPYSLPPSYDIDSAFGYRRIESALCAVTAHLDAFNLIVHKGNISNEFLLAIVINPHISVILLVCRLPAFLQYAVSAVPDRYKGSRALESGIIVKT
jgi:hypothetical protein